MAHPRLINESSGVLLDEHAPLLPESIQTQPHLTTNHAHSSGTYSRLTQALHITNPKVRSMLKHVVLPSALETMYACSVSAATASQLAPGSWAPGPFVFSAGFLTVNFLIRLYIDNQALPHGEQFKTFLRIGCGASFSIIDTMERNVLWHELGHLFAGIILYSDSHPFIQLNSAYGVFNGGVTKNINWTEPSAVGELLGTEKCEMVTRAAGGLMVQLASFISLITAQCISENYPGLKIHLRCIALMGLLVNVNYGLSAYTYDTKEEPAHDFGMLKEEGFSPALAVSLMISSLLILQLTMSATSFAIKKCRAPNKDIGDIEQGITRDAPDMTTQDRDRHTMNHRF